MKNFLLSTFYFLRTGRKGLTLLELLIFAGIFSMVIIGFITILVVVVRVQSRQSSVAEVNQQSQFLLQQIQYQIERSSLIEMPQDTSTSTLKLRMAADAEDPTIITLSGGTVYLDQGSGQNALTSDKVTVSSLTFIKRSNPPGHDSVDIAFTVEYNTPNIQRKFVQSLETAVARVSAASFDSNLVPSSTATYDLGVTSQIWRSVNNLIYFSGSNVGIGVSSPNAKLQVSGNLYLDTANNLLIMRDPSESYCWRYKPTTVTGAWNITSSTCP